MTWPFLALTDDPTYETGWKRSRRGRGDAAFIAATTTWWTTR
ncbi:MAG: hypothetical protein R2851_17755 [Caldilineaceae bacterium]